MRECKGGCEGVQGVNWQVQGCEGARAVARGVRGCKGYEGRCKG